jgi:hypothetical protein
MLSAMQQQAWLNQDHQFVPGKELFRSDRAFAVWAYTLSHSQLLLRTRTVTAGGRRQSRIDVLFKPVETMKTRMEYRDGLVIRCANTEERERVLADAGLANTDLKVLMLPTADGLDYVVTMAVGWREDEQEDREPSALAFFVPATDPTRLLPSLEPTPWSNLQAERD